MACCLDGRTVTEGQEKEHFTQEDDFAGEIVDM